MRLAPAVGCLCLLVGCEGAVIPLAAPDAGATDAGEGGLDGGTVDGGLDAGGGTPDAGAIDSGAPDAGSAARDAGTPIVVAVGYGARRVMSRDGVTWEHFQELTATGGDDDDLFRGATFGNGTFVAVGGAAKGYTLTSTDGVTWANENRTPRAWLGGVAPLGTAFVAAGGNGLRVRSVDLGKSWQNDPGYQPIHYRDVASSGAVAVAVGHNYDTTPNVGVIATTVDGVAWTERTHAGTPFNQVSFGNQVFVATGPAGRVAYSPDGAVWTDVTLAGTGGASVVFTDTAFVVSLGTAHFSSTDGATWGSVPGTRAIDGYFAGQYLSLDWPARIFGSTDRTQWTQRFSPLGSGFTRLVRGWAP